MASVKLKKLQFKYKPVKAPVPTPKLHELKTWHVNGFKGDYILRISDSIISARTPILVTIFIIFFALAILGVFFGNSNLTFGSFLGNLRDFNDSYPFDSKWIFTLRDSLTIKDDWGIFNWFRSFLNSFGSSLGLLLSLLVGLGQIIAFILSFIGIIY